MMPTNTRVIAVFDFDDTLVRGNSLNEFLSYSYPASVRLSKYFLLLPSYIMYRMGRRPLSEVKGRLLSEFLGDMQVAAFHKMCEEYCRRLNELTVPEALDRLRWHQAAGHTVVVESASIEDWIRPWASQHGVDQVIATRLKVDSGRITGGLAGDNCSGKEKVIRFLAEHPDRGEYVLYVYGDGATDQEILELADHPFLKCFS